MSQRTEHPCVLGSRCPQVLGSVRKHVNEHPGVFYVCPRPRDTSSRTGKARVPFHSVWFCGGFATESARRRAVRALRPARRSGSLEVFRSTAMLRKRGARGRTSGRIDPNRVNPSGGAGAGMAPYGCAHVEADRSEVLTRRFAPPPGDVRSHLSCCDAPDAAPATGGARVGVRAGATRGRGGEAERVRERRPPSGRRTSGFFFRTGRYYDV